MATINFYLDKPNSKNLRSILMTYQNKGLKFRHSTKVKVQERFWDFKAQRIKKNVSGEVEINSYLKQLVETINQIEREALLESKVLTLKRVKQEFEERLNKKADRRTFLDYFKEYVDSSKGYKAILTVKRYNSVLNSLKAFSDFFAIELNFENIDKAFYDGYVEYLMNDRGLLNNTVGSNIKTLKSFMNFATEKGYNKRNTIFKSFKVIKEDVDIIYLEEDELFKIYELEGLNEAQKHVRDIFCFGCFTGLRYSDTARIGVENINEDYIEIVTQKTKDFLKIPLNVYAKQILNRYEGKLPHSVSNQKTNDHLKVIGELAMIDKQILRVKYRGIIKIEQSEPKFKFLSTHTARRTFVTLRPRCKKS